jgi:hypothetical protein
MKKSILFTAEAVGILCSISFASLHAKTGLIRTESPDATLATAAGSPAFFNKTDPAEMYESYAPAAHLPTDRIITARGGARGVREEHAPRHDTAPEYVVDDDSDEEENIDDDDADDERNASDKNAGDEDATLIYDVN